ncbi:phage tail fiber protein [Aquibium microcysteis]|uniref:phage tail fiber domain-containing protein n=1 Tax=Aquibium microcysteis TaxID=675281 RepID=UPI00165D1767|nr:phage tail fiber protein [Aquibium microcysteis]
MAYEPNIVPGDGSTTDFSVPFPYLRREHVKVYVDGVLRAHTWVNPGMIRIVPAPSAGAAVDRRRDTPSTGLHTLLDNKPLPAANFNELTTQALYFAEEKARAAVEERTLAEQALAGSQAAQDAAEAAQGISEAIAQAVAADRTQTGLDRAAVAADRDAVEDLAAGTAADAIATAADRVQTGLDRTATQSAASAASTSAGAASTSASNAAADRVQTGLDRAQTGADRAAAQTARTGAETARGAAEAAQTGAQTARTGAETAAGTATTKAAEAAQSAVDAAAAAAGDIGPAIAAAPAKTPIDADNFILADSQDTNKRKRATWATLKATLKSYFDTLYAAVTHTHTIAQVTSLQTTLDGKAAASHTHTIAQVTNLQTTLDGKAAATHAHVIGDVTGLQAALDGKAASSHAHADATTGASGFMSAADKAKLNAIGSMANRVLTISASDPSGGVDGDVWFKV